MWCLLSFFQQMAAVANATRWLDLLDAQALPVPGGLYTSQQIRGLIVCLCCAGCWAWHGAVLGLGGAGQMGGGTKGAVGWATHT